MLQLIEANWIAFVAALLIGLLVAWWVFARGSKDAGRREHRPDVLDEGAERAHRNQALIDAPPAAAAVQPAPAAGAMAGIGEVVAVAAQDEVEQDAARRDMEETVEAREEAGLEDDAAPEVVPPADTPAPVPETAAAEEGDDLRRIKGVGPKLVALLHSLGVTRYAQIAAWSTEDLARIDAQLGAFQGRPQRDNWIEQARLLESGDRASYEAKFGKL